MHNFNKMIKKTILVGITYTDECGKEIKTSTICGIIKKISSDCIQILNNNSNSLFSLPPDLSAIKVAEPGVYKLKDTGEIIENPDYIAKWTIICKQNN